MATASETEELKDHEILRDETNFRKWFVDIKILLQIKHALQVAEGTEKKPVAPASAQEIDAWRTKDAKAQYYIKKTVSSNTRDTLYNFDTAAEMFADLQAVWNKSTSQQKCNLMMDFYNYQYDNSRDVLSNIAVLSGLKQQLNSVQENISESMLISRIICMLPDKFKHLRASWDSTPKESQTLTKSRLATEEKRMKNQDTVDEAVAFNASGKYRHPKRGKKFPGKTLEDGAPTTCHKCKKSGHVAADCWAGKTFSPCGFCQLTNHPRKDCVKEKWFKAKQARENCNRSSNSHNSGPRASYLCEIIHEANVTQVNTNETLFLADSGCSTHMVNNRDVLSNIRPSTKITIKTANKNGVLTSEEKGDLENNNVQLTEVSYVPNLSKNLLSVNAVTNKGGEVLFTRTGVKIFNAGSLVAKEDPTITGIKNASGLYEINFENSEQAMLTAKVQQDTMEWHRKMGHINFQSLKKVPKLCSGLPEKFSDPDKIFCEICVYSKQPRKSFSSVRYRAKQPMEISKVTPTTFDNKNYFIVVMDDFAHFTKVYLLEKKDEAEKFLKEFVREGETNFQLPCKTIRWRRKYWKYL